jgi:peptide deformylase
LAMAKLEIKIYDDPVLREKARPIKRIEERHKQLARDMAETMYGARGIGLAANQVGATERLIVVDVTWSERDGKKAQPLSPTVMINPEVLEEGTRDELSSEGCLSLPELEGDVWRTTRIRYRYQDLEGNVVEQEATDLLARCVLHEIDHLDGILFIDRMSPDGRERLAGKLAKLRKSRQSSLVS